VQRKIRAPFPLEQSCHETIGVEGMDMKTADFRGELAPDGRIAVPPEIASQVPPGAQIQVVLQWEISEDDTAWRTAGRMKFEAAYADDDSIYEQLIYDPSTR
jgi:hypothetical protein